MQNVECYIGYSDSPRWISASKLIRFKKLEVGDLVRSKALTNLRVRPLIDNAQDGMLPVPELVEKYSLRVVRIIPREEFYEENGVLRYTNDTNVYCNYPSAQMVAKLHVHLWNESALTVRDMHELMSELEITARWKVCW